VKSNRLRLRLLVTAAAAAVTVCLAGYWEFEQVDSGSLGSYVAIDKMSDGTIWLAYVNRDSAIRQRFDVAVRRLGHCHGSAGLSVLAALLLRYRSR
jgi:hypothetical protein